MLEEVPKYKSTKWQAARRRCEQFLNAAILRFNVQVRQGDHEAADRVYTDALQIMDELVQLAGAEK